MTANSITYKEAVELIEKADALKTDGIEQFARFSTMVQAALFAYQYGHFKLAVRLKYEAILIRIETGVWDNIGLIDALERKLESYDFVGMVER